MKKLLAGVLLAVITLLFTTALGLAFIHVSGFPYTVDVDRLDITESSGYSRAEIMLNYGAALSYLSPLSTEKFDLPTMKYSASGILHFSQCKTFFEIVYLIGAAALAYLICLCYMKSSSKITLRISVVFIMLIPALFSLLLAVNFNNAFTLFHKLFFSGSTWLFNPETDEIIKILPMSFFADCALIIVAFWIIGAAAQTVLSFSKKSAAQQTKNVFKIYWRY